MENITMTMHAASCVLSARPRTANVLLADSRAQGQGTTVSFANRQGRGFLAIDAPISGGVSRVVAPAYKPTDVVRSRSGRPPV